MTFDVEGVGICEVNPQELRIVTFDISPGPHQINNLTTALTVHTFVPRAMLWLWLTVSTVTRLPDWTNFAAALSINPPEFSVPQKGATITPSLTQFLSAPLMVITDMNGDVSVNACTATPTPAITDFWIAAQPSIGLFVSRQLTAADYTA